MIELIYFSKAETGEQAYQVVQAKPGECWEILKEDEIIGVMNHEQGIWNLQGVGEIPKGMASGIAKLIETQHFNTLPSDIKMHWSGDVHEVVMRSDSDYLVICKPEIDFERFEKLFKECISGLVKDPWEVQFNVYNASMSADFECSSKY